jgi:hypothetical protein
MMPMTGRQRVQATLSHVQPDRVPLDLGASRDTTMVVEGYQRLQAHFGAAGQIRLCERMMRVVQVEEPILQALDIDLRAIFPGAPRHGRSCELGPDRYRDDWGVERLQSCSAAVGSTCRGGRRSGTRPQRFRDRCAFDIQSISTLLRVFHESRKRRRPSFV